MLYPELPDFVFNRDYLSHRETFITDTACSISFIPSFNYSF